MAVANSAQPAKGSTQITMPSDREITMTRVFDAPRRLVWEAFTNVKHVPQWLLGPEGWTMPVCEMDLRKGGTWRYVWRKDSGEEMAMTGTFLEITPPERLVHTESWGPEWPETTNTLVLTETAGRTRMEQTMLFPSKEARDAALKTGMSEGATRSYDLLAAYLIRIS